MHRSLAIGGSLGALEHRVVDCTTAFAGLGKRVRIADTISVALTEHTYLPSGELTEGWFQNILRAYGALGAQHSAGGFAPRSFGSIGVGPGLDAIAAVEMLNVTDLVLTDVHDDVVELAKANVLANCPDIAPPRVQAFLSDVCSGLIQRQVKVDLLYENLPNLPLAEVEIGEGVTTASFFGRERMRSIPALFSTHRLVLHYIFLQQAHQCLTSRGAVICCIGGRIPIAVVRSMFDDCGYLPHTLNFDMVRQFESEKVLAGYVEAEAESGILFKFYPYDEGTRVLRELRDRGVTIDDVFDDDRLRSVTLSASQAQKAEASGTAIGHVGVVWRGVPKRS